MQQERSEYLTMTVDGSVVLRKANSNDLQLLFKISRQSYTENFAHHWNEGGLDWYLERSYGIEGISADLFNPGINYFIAFVYEEPAGFMKLQLNSSLPTHPSTSGIEIEKLYFRPQYQRRGIGTKLVNLALALGKELKKEIIWLGVIDTNEKAIAFYKKIGFVIHDKIVLDIPYFKEELRGMWRMTFRVSDPKV